MRNVINIQKKKCFLISWFNTRLLNTLLGILGRLYTHVVTQTIFRFRGCLTLSFFLRIDFLSQLISNEMRTIYLFQSSVPVPT